MHTPYTQVVYSMTSRCSTVVYIAWTPSQGVPCRHEHTPTPVGVMPYGMLLLHSPYVSLTVAQPVPGTRGDDPPIRRLGLSWTQSDSYTPSSRCTHKLAS